MTIQTFIGDVGSTRAEVVNDVLIDLVATLKMPAVEWIVKPVTAVDQMRRVKHQVRGPAEEGRQGHRV